MHSYKIQWSEEDKIYVVRSLQWPSVAAHGKTKSQALKEFKKVVEIIEEFLEEKRLKE